MGEGVGGERERGERREETDGKTAYAYTHTRMHAYTHTRIHAKAAYA